jgi:uncharacterized damage-inducible protein DinB
MKKMIPILLMVFFTNTISAQQKEPGTEQEQKAYLLNYFEQTSKQLQEAVEGLTEAQLSYRPTAGHWSISQCLEHILLTEKFLFQEVKDLFSLPPNPERKNEVEVTDEGLIKGMTDRSFKAQASEEVSSKEVGNLKDPSEAIHQHNRQKAEIVAFINGRPIEDMRGRISDSPFGPVDGYHFILYIPAHTVRHIKQIEELKAMADFPGK